MFRPTLLAAALAAALAAFAPHAHATGEAANAGAAALITELSHSAHERSGHMVEAEATTPRKRNRPGSTAAAAGSMTGCRAWSCVKPVGSV